MSSDSRYLIFADKINRILENRNLNDIKVIQESISFLCDEFGYEISTALENRKSSDNSIKFLREELSNLRKELRYEITKLLDEQKSKDIKILREELSDFRKELRYEITKALENQKSDDIGIIKEKLTDFGKELNKLTYKIEVIQDKSHHSEEVYSRDNLSKSNKQDKIGIGNDADVQEKSKHESITYNDSTKFLDKQEKQQEKQEASELTSQHQISSPSLTSEEEELITTYNRVVDLEELIHNNYSVREISMTEDTLFRLRVRAADPNLKILFKICKNGTFWLVDNVNKDRFSGKNDFDYLLPKKNILLEKQTYYFFKHVYEFFQNSIVDTDGDKQDNFVVKKPAQVRFQRQEEKWELIEKGQIRFGSDE